MSEDDRARVLHAGWPTPRVLLRAALGVMDELKVSALTPRALASALSGRPEAGVRLGTRALREALTACGVPALVGPDRRARHQRGAVLTALGVLGALPSVPVVTEPPARPGRAVPRAHMRGRRVA